MSHELQVTDVSIYPYVLSVTTRANGETPEVMAELTYRTIAMWLHITKYLKQGVHKLEGGSVEQRYADEINKRVDTDSPLFEPFEFKETFGDSRVTVWDTYRGAEHPCFHLNSDDNPQVAIDVWVAQGNGIKKAIEKFAPKDDETAPEQMQPATPKNAPQQSSAPNAPTAPQNAGNANVGSFYTKNEAIEKLAVGTVFNMRICQIKLRSKDDQHYYELYAKYGQNVGKYPEISLYTDNEVALKNGLIADLDKFGLKPGESKLGEWILSCNVGKPKVDGDKTYGRVYADSFVSS